MANGAKKIKVTLKLTMVAILCAMLLAPSSASSQDSLRIAAVVNDDVISGFDLFSRMRLVMGLSRIQDSREARQRLAPQVLRGLIDEALQAQEAERLDIAPTEEQINATLGRLEQANGIPPNGLDDFLARIGVPKSNVIAEVRTRLAWRDVVGRLFGSSVDISDQEVSDELAEIRANTGKPEYLVGEIFLPFENASQAEQVRQLTGRIIRQIRSGTPFSALARNFSQNPTAATGGDLGWVQAHQLDADIAAVVQNLEPGRLSEPLVTVAGIYLLVLRDKRISQGPVDPEATINIQQLFIPVPDQTNVETVQRQGQLAANLRSRAVSCSAMEQLKGATGSPASGNLGDLRRDGLSPPIRNALKGLTVGVPSDVMRFPKGFAILMICSESASEDGEENIREQIRRRLLSERLENAARRHLRELRRNAFIDIRL